ncbi:MAG: glycosyltransferase [Burkholderiaceae bacterium]
MKLVVATYGTEGDARPMAALCRAWIDAGHSATLLADAATLDAAAALDVPTVALAGDIRAALRPGRASSSDAGQSGSMSQSTRAIMRIPNAHADDWVRQIADCARDADGIVAAGLAAFAALSVAEQRRLPVAGAGLFPLHPTKAFAAPFLPPARVPRWLNRASHVAINALLWRNFRSRINDARGRVLGLPPRTKMWADYPMLYGISPTLLPRPADWPDEVVLCGLWRTAARPDWTPPAPLADFLAGGDAPIYIGFGSMAGFDRRRLLDAMIGAVAGRRALFYPGWSGIDTSTLPANFHVVGNTPHDWLLPRTALAIHHGGSGTTHSVAAAGVPAVIMPFAGDQPFWADRMHALGIAAAPVDGKRPSAAALATAIETALQPGMRARAQAIADAMAGEDGLARAVETMRKIFVR